MRRSLHTSLATPARRLLLATALAAALTAGSVPALAQDSDLDALGATLVEEFTAILKGPDADKAALLDDFLAPEFQIVRATGTVIDKGGYMADPPTVVENEVTDARATEADGVLVVSFTLAVEETLEGVAQSTVAPRLAVFRMSDDGAWRLSAYANFGAISPAD